MKKLFRKDDEAVSPVIAVILMVAITVVLAGVLYVWVSSFGGGGTSGVSISSSYTDKTHYYKLDIIKVSGGTLSIDDAKFLLVSKQGIQEFRRTITDANPEGTDMKSGDSRAYPIPVDLSDFVNYDDDSTADPRIVANTDLDEPEKWENCTFSFLDAQDDKKINAGDVFWIYKDYNDDGTDDVVPGYVFKILDGKDNEVLTKEF